MFVCGGVMCGVVGVMCGVCGCGAWEGVMCGDVGCEGAV